MWLPLRCYNKTSVPLFMLSSYNNNIRQGQLGLVYITNPIYWTTTTNTNMCLSGGRGCHRLKRHCTHKNVAQRDAAAEPVGATWE